ncbi:MAG: hypothetical protein A3C85_01420 [Candidatus Doudnabacteria bacterium RIFCSPHIGHO2_02_FULL_48_21]|uniref:Uncharacterized protein n=1 Tax=Candidatus Doudnabacteria bacterium RIFCSPLOWO2_02_FULL_48_13 TaxID=1817845 RepID=A0A1F5Q9P3_9BACT|nr:MAG: hypothetical protein A2668_02335 [Candidatus Doudnabacteria bacterium RIFCSPHIGHO2_01_FULL_48_180]OGE91739.1 MAG: hypothetical protein A3F44_00430 [Candidatus Doudnabacteria bacterium RIFCSPHIGHO2_12_FULL_47_25]OGE93943.1 MAG: hypothetical protein A3C85_01420 [Candidatus Doudnabacteria bacterium RIFCSPHIGHO2_02_FULL_48_21]OGE98022.1 MAG: hypothetical protein A3A83_00295 [Candidatus Doudnabacteria bacterium RIFCSPLOWO2_01_FULL_48_57]OGE98622.1 MAG: hypothetical protein A3J05_00960 [Candi
MSEETSQIASNEPHAPLPPAAPASLPPPPLSAAPAIARKDSLQIWDKLIRGLIYACVFLLPLIFTPWTFEVLELSKQMLLYVLVSSAAVLWLLKLLVTRNWRFVKTSLDLPILALLAVYLLASIFSVDRISSFLGPYGIFSGNFFELLFLVIFYYLVVNNFDSPSQLKKLFSFFFASVFLALVYAVLQFSGWFVLRAPFAKTGSFNTIGTLISATLIAAFAIVLSLGFKSKSIFRFPNGKLWRFLLGIAAFVILLTINFFYAWVALLAGLLLHLIFSFALSRFSFKSIVVPLALVIAVASFLVLQTIFQKSFGNVFKFELPLQLRLDYSTALPAIKGAVFDKPILGSGPGTFNYVFSQYRDQAFNLSQFWTVRFDKAPSEAVEYLTGTGILGFLVFEVFNLLFIAYAIMFLLQNREQSFWAMGLALLSGYAVLWVSHWFLFFNTFMAFSSWFTIAVFMTLSRFASKEQIKSYDFSFATSPRQTVSIVSASSLGLVLIVVFMFFSISVYAADVSFRKGLNAVNKAETFDDAEMHFENATRMNRFRSDYFLTYGEYLFGKVNRELEKKNPNIVEIQSLLTRSINTARTAVTLNPNNGQAWGRLAGLYGYARPMIAGVDKFIIDSLTQAVENDKSNPVLYTDLGQAYRLTARTIDPAILGKGVDSDLDGLSDEQERALGSNLDDRDTNGNSVTDGNEVLAGLNPAASGQLPDGFLSKYVKVSQDGLIKAEEAFRKAIELKPDHAIAYYQLALSIEQSGDVPRAIETLENALAKLPNNLTFKFDLGRMYFNTGRVDEAARQFQEILVAAPGHANSRFSLALSFERLGRTARALDEYRRVLELSPGNQNIKAKIRELEAAVAPRSSGTSQ